MKQLNRNDNQGHEGKRDDAKPGAWKSKAPMAEGRLIRFLRRSALALGITLAPAVMVATQTGCGNGYAITNKDAQPEDAGPKDGSVDASHIDASHMDAGPDARADAGPDATVGHDSGIDGGHQDAQVDAEVDAGPPVCVTVEQNQPFWLLQLGTPDALGGYWVLFKSQNGNDVTFDITCDSTQALVATDEVFTLNVLRTIYLSEGDKNFSVRITNVWPNITQLEASVSNP